MSARRKRASSSPEPSSLKESNAEGSSAHEEGKRSKTFSDIDELKPIPADQAFHFDSSQLFEGAENRGIRVICVVESLNVHYHLLLAMLPTYVGACAIVRDPQQSPLGNDSHPIPVKAAIGPDFNHFLKLGVLHPMGGGQTALDSVIILDHMGRRRLVLPFGWGAGRHILDEAGGALVREKLIRVFWDTMGELLSEGNSANNEAK